MSSFRSPLASIDIGHKCRSRMPANQPLLRLSESFGPGHKACDSVRYARFKRFNERNGSPHAQLSELRLRKS